MHHLHCRGLGRKLVLLGGCVSLVGPMAATLGGCATTTRTVVLTNTTEAKKDLVIRSTDSRDGWNYERQLEHNESFELKLSPGKTIQTENLRIQVR